ncbi:MAG: tyrosine-type recombinase/integrase [Flavobacteriales bacterium]|nr:tyrosine-type recombinase/integrase [Flavobacteriales bacterium]
MQIKFFVVKGKNNISSIYVRFWDSNRIDQKSKTGLSVNYESWSKSFQQIKNTVNSPQKDFVNSKIRELRVFIVDEYNIDFNTQQHIGSSWLKDKIKKFFGRAYETELDKIYFTSWVQKFIDECPKRLYKGKPIAKRTIQHYITTINKLYSYEKHFNTRLRFQDINLDFYRNFLHYCLTVEKLNNNTTGGYIINLKMWCKNIEIEGLPINLQYKHSEFASISNKTKDVYLSENEINTIYNHDFSYSERLLNARDNFIIGLRTGLRISDFMKLKKINLKNDFIEIETSKTSHPVIIPMHEQVKEILTKRNGELPHQISDQKFNEYIKEVCKIVGFTETIEGAKMVNKKDEEGFFKTKKTDLKNKTRKEFGKFPKHELISSHVCRRSFATNLYGLLPNMTIMAITGHKTETQFLKYIKITPKEHAEKLKEHWSKELK